MLKQAMKLLYLQYEDCMEKVRDDAYYSHYAQEKIRHSLQVAGAGNYLLKHILWFQDKTPEYLEMVRTAVLLHDVCRFSEISKKYQKFGKYDHGAAAYEFLWHTPLFDDIRIRLPIKHHGHLIDALYDDAEYQSLEPKLQQQIEYICFVIRDADKIANFNMVTHEPYFVPLFLERQGELLAEDLMVSEHVKVNAFVETTVPYPLTTVGDRVAAFISWYMDINYQAAIDYCYKLGLVDLMFAMFDKYCQDTEFKKKYAAFVRDYLAKHQYLR